VKGHDGREKCCTGPTYTGCQRQNFLFCSGPTESAQRDRENRVLTSLEKLFPVKENMKEGCNACALFESLHFSSRMNTNSTPRPQFQFSDGGPYYIIHSFFYGALAETRDVVVYKTTPLPGLHAKTTIPSG